MLILSDKERQNNNNNNNNNNDNNNNKEVSADNRLSLDFLVWWQPIVTSKKSSDNRLSPDNQLYFSNTTVY